MKYKYCTFEIINYKIQNYTGNVPTSFGTIKYKTMKWNNEKGE